MKNLLPKIDKIGLVFFSLILFAGMYELSRIDFSVEQNINWQFYIFLLAGFLVIFRSIWFKFASLSLSVLVICSTFGFFINIKFEAKTFGVLVHNLYSQGISFWDLLPFISLIAVTIYNLCVIMIDLLIESKKKINLK